LAVDVVVNAANNTLLGGGGVDGAIHKAAGKELLAECKTLNGCETACAKITKGYKLPAKHVIHTVGPKGENADLLQTAYANCLDLAVEKKIENNCFSVHFYWCLWLSTRRSSHCCIENHQGLFRT